MSISLKYLLKPFGTGQMVQWARDLNTQLLCEKNLSMVMRVPVSTLLGGQVNSGVSLELSGRVSLVPGQSK